MEPRHLKIEKIATKKIVFDWDTSLAHMTQDNILALFSDLTRLGIDITIVSKKVERDKIIAFFNEANICYVTIPYKVNTLLEPLHDIYQHHLKIGRQLMGKEICLVSDSEDVLIVREAGYVTCSAENGNFINDIQHDRINTDINKAKQGIVLYKNYKDSHVFFLDSTVGKRRANIYQQLLKTEDPLLKKAIILYALFASKDGKTLQTYVASQLGFESLKQARQYYKNEIQRIITAAKFDQDMLHRIDKKIVSELVYYANSNVEYNAVKCEAIFNILYDYEKPLCIINNG